MPAWLSAALIRYVVPYVIKKLVAAGALNKAEALAIRYGLAIRDFVDGLELYHDRDDFPEAADLDKTKVKKVYNFNKKK